MKIVRNIMLMVGLIAVVAYAKQITRLPEQVPAVPMPGGVPEEVMQPGSPRRPLPPTPVRVPIETPEDLVQPDITPLPQSQMNSEEYARNKVAVSVQQLISDIFPREETIGKIVVAFKEQFPGPNKQADVAILYNAIMYNPEIRKFVTLENSVPVYKFVTEAINKAWDKHDNWIWSR